jgi:transcriptional regulator with XRE-family HTH domain
MNFGNAIKKIRVHLGLNQKDLADICDISQNSLSQIECGLKSPKERTLDKIARILNVPLPLLYLLAIEQKDVPESRHEHFAILQGSITGIALQVAWLEKKPLVAVPA